MKGTKSRKKLQLKTVCFALTTSNKLLNTTSKVSFSLWSKLPNYCSIQCSVFLHLTGKRVVQLLQLNSFSEYCDSSHPIYLIWAEVEGRRLWCGYFKACHEHAEKNHCINTNSAFKTKPKKQSNILIIGPACQVIQCCFKNSIYIFSSAQWYFIC